MAGDRLTGSDKRALLFWVVLGILGAVFAQKYFFRAFPEASVNFQVSREEARKRAQNFVTALGSQPAHVFGAEYLVLERALLQASSGGGISRSREPRRADHGL